MVIKLVGYQILEELYAGTHTRVYRGIGTSNPVSVVIKILRNPYPTFDELVQFRNQYTIAKNLDFPGIIKPLELQVYENRYALIMEDFGGISLYKYLKITSDKDTPYQSLPLAEFLEIMIQLTEIINYLHQNRVIHKDIKPANILINPDTKKVKLIDFSISSLLPRETQEIQNPNILEGTLPYISPEQTGRMNRGIDYRSDFYSLGVTCYQLLTGKLPFQSSDIMELVHCHLAKQAIPIHHVNLNIPIILSEIINKLMAKNAEDRYQSALGIQYDLQQCLTQLQTKGKIEYFEICQQDISDQFIIPEKLYGRTQEVKQLLNAFDRVNLQGTEMMLVGGFSGIGKTAVVNEVHKPIVRQRGYFIKGKYDQFNRNIPFSAFVQAFRDLMEQLLSESDTQIQSWKTRILAAVGENGQVLTDVIPELEQIIGKQPPAVELSGNAAQNRFNLLFQKFVQVFTQKEHPLVLFLDDLQWSDSASLNLLQLLMQDSLGYLLILGAYRDNEVSPVHPFILTINEIVKTGAIVNTITLPPLTRLDLNQLVADTLNCQPDLVEYLTQLVDQKTQGNPFFATQFLKALHEDKLIQFDSSQFLKNGSKLGGWQCDMAQIEALSLTDDVVEFMALQLQKLPIETQDILKLAACIGAEFDLNTLAIISEKSAEITATTLWTALQKGLVIPTTKIYKFFTQIPEEEVFNTSINPAYRFLHDRVQQAAYCLIAAEEKQSTHFEIGTLLLQNFSLAEREERIFEIVNHLNIGKALIIEETQKEELAKLNLLAGIKAKASTAYSDAFTYIKTAMELLPIDTWKSHYDLSLNLFKERAELEYFQGNFDQAEYWLKQALKNAKLPLEKAEIYNMAIVQYTMQAKYPEAIQSGRQALALVNIDLPETDWETVRDLELAQIQETLENRLFSDLIHLPMMTEIEPKMAIKLLIAMGPPTYRSHQRLWSVICAKAVNLCLKYGNTPEIGYIYPAFGGLRGYALNNYQNTSQLIDVTLELMQTFNNKSAESVAYLMIGSSLRHWSHPLKIASEDYDSSYRVGLESSNLQYAAYAFGHNMYCRFYQSVFLEKLLDEITESLTFSRKYKNQWAIDLFLGGQIILAELIGHTVDLKEVDYLQQCHEHKNWQVICIYNILKSQLLFINEQWEKAFDYSQKADDEIINVAPQGLLPYVHHCFIHALLLIKRYPHLPQEQKQSCWDKISHYQEQLNIWAENNPDNFLPLSCLVNAEIDRISDNFLKAMDNYDRAIRAAKNNESIQAEALANELAAKFYLDWGKEKVAAGYMQEAYYSYAQWGAKVKVADLEKTYPKLLKPILQHPQPTNLFEETIGRGTVISTHTSTSISEALDLKTLIKASKVISSEIELNKLLVTLLEIVVANAGANKCVLLLIQDELLQVVAQLKDGQSSPVFPPIPLELSEDVPINLVNNVKRNLKHIVLEDARMSSRFIADIYIQKNQPKSVLCSPIINQ
ncbi:MAG TPA: serine/threonine-protein kinase PknK, partial [Candidatus Obscuribacterales bacterium]